MTVGQYVIVWWNRNNIYDGINKRWKLCPFRHNTGAFRYLCSKLMLLVTLWEKASIATMFSNSIQYYFIHLLKISKFLSTCFQSPYRIVVPWEKVVNSWKESMIFRVFSICLFIAEIKDLISHLNALLSLLKDP